MAQPISLEGSPATDDPAIQRLRTAIRELAVVTADRQRTGVSHDAADDTLGTVTSDDAIGFDPIPLLRAFDEVGARVVVIGQVAGIMHGSTELTGDLDLLWDGSKAQAVAMLSAFSKLGTQLWDDDDVAVEVGPAAFRLAKVVFRTPWASGDCCTPALPWGEIPVADFLGRCEIAAAAEGFQVRYLRRDDLIAMRRAVGRPKDLRRADELSRLAD